MYIFSMNFLKHLGFSTSHNKGIGLSSMNMYQGFAMYIICIFLLFNLQAFLKKEGVKVFQMNSRNENMMLEILEDPDKVSIVVVQWNHST